MTPGGAGSARWLLGAASTLAAPAALAAPLPEKGYGLPRDVSAHGHLVDWLIHYTMAAAAIIFVLVLAAMVWSAVRHGRRHQALYTHGSRGSVGFLLGSVGLIALVVDGNLFVRTILDMNEVFWNFAGAEKDPAAVRIEVNAHQWAWLARYPGPDGKFGTEDDVVTLNDIRIPVGAPVVVQLASTDVIHSFYLPNFRVKRDAVPGMVNGLTFQARRTGEYEIGCAQHCGPNHYKMRGVLTVLGGEEYRSWLRGMEEDARRGYDADDKDAHWGWEWRSL
jgi:cytochrome c oxidase subunit 2